MFKRKDKSFYRTIQASLTEYIADNYEPDGNTGGENNEFETLNRHLFRCAEKASACVSSPPVFGAASTPIDENRPIEESFDDVCACKIAAFPEVSYEAAFAEEFDEDETNIDFLENNMDALSERLEHIADSFSEYLFYLIEKKGLGNSDVYKRALITKQVFSKIKINHDYHPDKSTAMRLCIGARLNLDQTKDLLARAGYALSPSDKTDIIFSFFIENEIYDMYEIDIALEDYGLPCFIV